MEVLELISSEAEQKKIDFLVIGGHAVNHYGISRQTGDIDFVARRSQKDSWSELLMSLEKTTKDLLVLNQPA